MTDPSAISVAARAFREHFQAHPSINEAIKGVKVLIGHPAVAGKLVQDADAQHYVNLFIYHIEHAGYAADSAAEDPLFVKLHCLVTAFAKDDIEKDEDGQDIKIKAGEIDLRLIGALMQEAHKSPLLDVKKNGDDEPIARLQIVPVPMTVDDMNKIWSTQVETSYRPSVVYELALLPVPLAERVETSTPVGALGVRVQGDMEYAPLPDDGFNIATRGPYVRPVKIDPKRPDWTPHICFVDDQGSVQHTIALPVGASNVNLFVVGDPEEEAVRLHWQSWDKELEWVDPDPVAVATIKLDPHQSYAGQSVSFSLPPHESRQWLIHAERTRKNGSVVRSNPLLLTLYKEGQ